MYILYIIKNISEITSSQVSSELRFGFRSWLDPKASRPAATLLYGLLPGGDVSPPEKGGCGEFSRGDKDQGSDAAARPGQHGHNYCHRQGRSEFGRTAGLHRELRFPGGPARHQPRWGKGFALFVCLCMPLLNWGRYSRQSQGEGLMPESS